MNFIKKILIIISLLVTNNLQAQDISGFVYDESNNPIPYVKVFLKNSENTSAITDLEGKYFNGCYMSSDVEFCKHNGFDDLHLTPIVSPLHSFKRKEGLSVTFSSKYCLTISAQLTN